MHILKKHCHNHIDFVRAAAEQVVCGATGPTFRLGSESTGAPEGVYAVEAYVSAMEPAKQKVRSTARDEELD
jgi:hypothetical protein